MLCNATSDKAKLKINRPNNINRPINDVHLLYIQHLLV